MTLPNVEYVHHDRETDGPLIDDLTKRLEKCGGNALIIMDDKQAELERDGKANLNIFTGTCTSRFEFLNFDKTIFQA